MAIQSDGRKLWPWHILALAAAFFGRALGGTNAEIARSEKAVYRAGHSVELPAAVNIASTPVLQPCSVLQVESLANLSITLEQTFRRFASDDDFTFLATTAEDSVVEGPYFIQNGRLRQAYLLYPDVYNAFIVATIPTENDPTTYQSLDVSVFGQDWPSSLTIAVPSRLYFKKTSNRPLAGLRFAVKDNTDLKGLRTGGSSRAYTRLREPCLQSAAVVETLLDLGAVPVGKTKTTQFGDTEWATRDWVGYHAPFTPRADGYQGPSGSSSGSGAAMAAYDWLDFATGTDSCGSIRSPAAVEGLFAMRPSLGAAETNGLIPWSKTLRHVCIHDSMEPRLNTWLPKRLILPIEYWNLEHQETREVTEQFVRAVEAHLKVKRTELSLEDEWQKGNPISTTEPLLVFFNMTLPYSYGADQHSFYETFAQDHKAIFGVPPYFNPEGQFKMHWLPAMGREQQKQGLEEMSIFKKWFEESILQVGADGYPEAIVLLPWTFGKPDYRDLYQERPTWFGHGFHFYCISPFAQAPDIMVPTGQTSFQSKVTGCREWLLASVGVISAHGTDRQLVNLIKDILHSTDLPTSTLTGFVAFEAGEPRRATNAGLGVQKLLSWPWRT